MNVFTSPRSFGCGCAALFKVLRKSMIDGRLGLDLRGWTGCGTDSGVGALGSPGRLGWDSPSAKFTYLRGHKNRWQ